MRPSRHFAPFKTVVVLVLHGCDSADAVTAARAICPEGEVVLAGLVGLKPDEPLSVGAVPAQDVRRTLRTLSGGPGVRYRARVRVSHTPWQEVIELVWDERADLLILPWPRAAMALNMTAEAILDQPPCNIALVRGPIPQPITSALLTMRGGPYAELSLQIGLAMAESQGTSLTAMHIRKEPVKAVQEGGASPYEPPFRGLARVLDNLPEVARQETVTDDPAEAIVNAARQHDIVIMGSSAFPIQMGIALGPVAERVVRESASGVIIARLHQPYPDAMDEQAGKGAISILVDKWFAENTYSAEEFGDFVHLLRLKEQQGTTIALALPALNEEATVGNVISTIRHALMEQIPVVDEIVLMDSNSDDRTRLIAEELGVPVFIHQHVLPDYGPRTGKGEALWKSLYCTRSDIVLWIDTDIVNIHPRFVYGLIGPFLIDPRIQFVKGFYRRPLRVGDKIQAGGGGRVTELTARPLLNLFYPELSGIVQPLAGEYGGRRAALEQLPFFSGYGVEIGLLIDMFDTFGLSAIAQVDLQERIHHNQPLESLSKMSFAIIQAVLEKLSRRYGRTIVEDVNRTMKLIRYDERFFLELEEIAERDRPPMIEIPEYAVQQRDAR